MGFNSGFKGLKYFEKWRFLWIFFFSFVLEYVIRRVQVKPGWLEIKRSTSVCFMLMTLIYWTEVYIL